MPIFQAGQFNTTALTVPGVYVQQFPPGLVINGLPTNIGGFVGTAAWGPLNKPTLVSNTGDYGPLFGGPTTIINRLYDLGTAVFLAQQQGQAGAYACVRVSDGTDTAATGTIQTTGLTLTAAYTGSGGNNVTWLLTNGTQPNTYCLVLQRGTFRTERIDNISGTGNTFWINLAAAVNSGNGFNVGASQLCTAAAGALTAVPTLTTTPVALTGGTDGVATITSAVLMGTDGAARKGMYALRGMGTSSFCLVDCVDSTTFATQLSFGISEATEIFVSTTSGDTAASAAASRNTLGLDNQSLHIMLGDFAYWFDTFNNAYRYNATTAIMVGLRANLSPHLDTLNKPIFGIIGTQRTQSGALPYSDADIQVMSQGRIDVIAQPPQYALQKSFTPRLGQTTSSDQIMRNDSYIQMMNYISRTYAASLFTFIGANQGFTDRDDTRNAAKAAMDGWLTSLQTAKMIQAFYNEIDASLNPPAQVMIGYMTAKSTVQFYGVVRYFLIDLQGGVTDSVTPATSNFQPSLQPYGQAVAATS